MKCVIVGDAGVGKTSLVKRSLTGDFPDKHVATLGVEVQEIDEHNHLWDTSGSTEYQGLGAGYYVGGTRFLVMFDVNKKKTWDHVPTWIDNIRGIVADPKILVCGNKVDVGEREVTQQMRDKFTKDYPGIKQIDLSVKSCYQIEEPFNFFKRL